MNKFNAIAKVLGVATAGMLVYNAGSKANSEARKNQAAVSGNRMADEYINSMRIDSYDAIGNGIKKNYFKWQLGQGVPELFSAIGGYVKGFGGNIVENILPAGLATGALLSKGILGRACGIGLAVNAVSYFAYNIMGVGKPKSLGFKS